MFPWPRALLPLGALLSALVTAGGCGEGADAPARVGIPADQPGRAEQTAVAEPPSSVSSADAVTLVRAPKADGDVMLIEVTDVREKLERRAPVLVVDARGRRDFESEHIPGAVNVPLQKIAAAGQLPGVPRDYEIVVYCIAETCPISRNAARALARLGYTNVKDMRAGLVGWKRAGFETASGGG